MSPSVPRKPTVQDLAHTVIRELRALRDSERAKGVQQYFKQEIVALGIDTPTLRGYCRAHEKQLKRVWTIHEAITLCDQLLNEDEMELRGAGFLILGAFKKEFTPDLLPWAKRWLDTRLNNWALVDGFCGEVLSPLLEQHPSVETTLRGWSRARLLWVRRAALVTLVPFARRGQFLDLAYTLAQEHFADPEDLMHKATGWLMREAGKTDMPRLCAFLLEHGPGIPRTALRYAIERFPASERARLLQQTRRQINRDPLP